MTWRARRKVRYYAKCSCGRTYTRRQWQALKNLGVMQQPADEYGPESNVEMRNCVCGSTMGVEKGPNVSGDRKTIREGDRVAMPHPHGRRVPGWMLGEAEDGYAVWDKGEPLDRTPLTNKRVVHVDDMWYQLPRSQSRGGWEKALARDPGYKKGKIRPLTPVAQRKAAVTAFKRKFKGATIEGVRKTSAGWRVRGYQGYRAVRAIFTYRQLMGDIKGRRAEKGYPKRARKGSTKKRVARDHGRGYYITVRGKKKWFATKSAANRFKARHGGRLIADRVKGSSKPRRGGWSKSRQGKKVFREYDRMRKVKQGAYRKSSSKKTFKQVDALVRQYGGNIHKAIREGAMTAAEYGMWEAEMHGY